MTSTRARALATLPALGLDGLPADLTRAVTAYDAIMAMRPPAPPPGPRTAITDAASQALSAAYRKGSTTVTIDTGPVTQARAAEAGHADRAAILSALREAAPAELCRIADEHRAQVIAALKRKHAAILGELVPTARRLPPGITETAALDAGGQIRLDYLATRDLASRVEQLRAVLLDVEDVPARGQMPGGLEISLTHIRDPRIYDGPRGEHGHPGTPEFYRSLGAETDPGDWWLPTMAERRARADEIAGQRRTADIQRALGPNVITVP